jgi:hypothetical protein
VLLVALAYVGLQPFYARFVVVDRAPWAAMLAEFPDRRFPGYLDLLQRAADVVPHDAAVAVVFPTLEWHRGYSYAYFRAQYFLPGRRVVPLGWPTGARPERLAEAEWVVAFGTPLPDGAWTVVAEVPDGRVARRTR